LGSNKPNDAAKKWLKKISKEIVLPKVPFVFVRTDKANGCLVERAINSSSTSFLYGKVFYNSGRPNGWWNNLTWWKTDKRNTWLHADSPVRQTGQDGVGRWDRQRKVFRAQQNDGEYFDIAREDNVKGWNEIPIPGEPFFAVRYGPNGAHIIVGDVDDESQPPVEPPTKPPVPPVDPPDPEGKYPGEDKLLAAVLNGAKAEDATTEAEREDRKARFREHYRNWYDKTVQPIVLNMGVPPSSPPNTDGVPESWKEELEQYIEDWLNGNKDIVEDWLKERLKAILINLL